MHINFKQRKEDHTNAAIEFATALPATPATLEIHYPTMLALYPPCYYKIIRGSAIPIPRARLDEVDGECHVIFMPDKTARVIWK